VIDQSQLPVPKGETVTVRRFLMPLTLSAMTALCVEVAAQGAFPSPSSTSDAASQDVFSQGAPPLGGGLAAGAYSGGQQGGGSASAAERQDCMEKFAPLRRDAEKRAQAIKAASDRKAPPKEACGLITSYVQAEAELVNYVTTKQTACGIPAEILKQLKANQASSRQLMKAVCANAIDPRYLLPPEQRPFKVWRMAQVAR
jgi:hypothetical protein